ncbi:MAG: hypothetical protein HY901_38350 [Deltaproteobacteria bacterium]|nr:hypothetical protein [Deltaproteobacteria bacterium]
MKSFARGMATLACIVGALLVSGCGSHQMTCQCKDGEKVQESTTGNQEDRCPDICSSHGGWSGTCVDTGQNDCEVTADAGSTLTDAG